MYLTECAILAAISDFVSVVQGFLAASPDGLVGRDGLVEVKCPLRCAELSVAELTRQDSSFCLQVRQPDPEHIFKT